MPDRCCLPLATSRRGRRPSRGFWAELRGFDCHFSLHFKRETCAPTACNRNFLRKLSSNLRAFYFLLSGDGVLACLFLTRGKDTSSWKHRFRNDPFCPCDIFMRHDRRQPSKDGVQTRWNGPWKRTLSSWIQLFLFGLFQTCLTHFFLSEKQTL